MPALRSCCGILRPERKKKISSVPIAWYDCLDASIQSAGDQIDRVGRMDRPAIDTEKEIWELMNQMYGDEMHELFEYGRRHRGQINFEWYEYEKNKLEFVRRGKKPAAQWRKVAADLGVLGY